MLPETRRRSQPPEVALRRVGAAERDELERMMDEHLPELASQRELAVGPVTAQDYEYLPLYWTEPGRHPFFIESGGERVGFVLVREVARRGIIEMSEFYVRPERRRAGFGRAALASLWRCFPGAWELQVHAQNAAAAAFWPRCIGEHASGPVTVREVEAEDGRRLQYEFEIAPDRRARAR